MRVTTHSTTTQTGEENTKQCNREFKNKKQKQQGEGSMFAVHLWLRPFARGGATAAAAAAAAALWCIRRLHFRTI